MTHEQPYFLIPSFTRLLPPRALKFFPGGNAAAAALNVTDPTSTGIGGEKFLIEGVPSGEQSLILLADEGGNEVRVNIPSGGKLSLGVVRFIETATP